MVVPVAVNVSPTDLVGDELVDLLAEGLRDYDLPPGQVTLEITERDPHPPAPGCRNAR